MTVAIGTRLGPYEVLESIGAGGMGEVWKARDTRLDRIVAIKISNEQFSERFDREARAVAALNHPHICQLYDVGPNYLVMEFIEGSPLKGPLPIDKAVDYAGQILEALDAAHRKGIIHRDLKPANILLTRQGIKLLDFGLAKQAAPLKESDVTVTHALTQQGQILGTLQYMSPEQLQGKDTDARSDLFAFGCVLYEVLTGKRAFEGENAASVIAAILDRDPAPLTTAPPLERVIRRSLAKDPDQRFQTARDLKAAMLWAVEHPPQSPAPAAARSKRRWPWIATAAAALVLGAVGGWAVSHFRQPPARDLVRLSINPPEGAVFMNSLKGTVTVPAPQLSLSRDGRAIVFAAASTDGRLMLWTRSLDDTTARPLAGTEDASDSCWSPDGRWLAFVANGKLMKVPIAGGPVQVIATAGNPRGASWSADGTILFASGNTGIMRVPSSGGVPAAVTTLDVSREEGSHRWPVFLPDGRHFLYSIRSTMTDQVGLYVGSLDGKTKKMLIHTDSMAAYGAPGYVLYLDGDTLLAQPFDADRLEVTGQPSVVATEVGHGSSGYGSFSLSGAGLLAFGGPVRRSGRLTWCDRDGKVLGTVAPPGDYVDFRLSPDQKHVAASLVNPKSGNADIWLTDIARASTARFTSGFSVNASLVWSPDSTQIVYRSARKGMAELYRRSASGAGKDQPVLLAEMQRTVLTESNNTLPTDWSPDGRTVLYSTATTNFQLWVIDVASAGAPAKPVRLIDSPADLMQGAFSPDGKLVAYTSNESGRWEVHVQTFPLSDRKWQVSTTGGYEPRWRADGREIFYLSPDRQLMAVAVNGGPTFGVPKALFQTLVPAGVNASRTNYVPARDGQRFLVNTQSGAPAPNPITVVLNWTAALKKD